MRTIMDDSYTIYHNNPEILLGKPFYDWRKYLFQGVAEYLCFRGFDVTHAIKDSFDIFYESSEKKSVAIPDSMAIMQNDLSEEFFVLDCHDLITPVELLLFISDPRCRKVLKCQYDKHIFKDGPYEKVKPWTYYDRFWPKNEQKFLESRSLHRTSNSLYFRGADWAKRDRILEELIKRGIINSDFQAIDFDDYFRETVNHRIILSLPGVADICNRDVEGFGSGTCVLRPKVKTTFHNDLIPDIHYVSVDIDVKTADHVTVADKIEQRFTEIVDDHAYIAQIVENAASWYDKNVKRAAALELTARLLEFI